MKTDIEIAQEAAMIPIKEVAASYGISEEDLELYGRYKAKLTDELWGRGEGQTGWKIGSGYSHQPDSGRRGKDHDHGRTGRKRWKDGQKGHHRAA